MTAYGLAILFSITLFFLLLSVCVLWYEKENQGKRYRKQEDWLLSGFTERFFQALFAERPPEEVAVKMKVNLKEYYSDYGVAGKEPDLVKYICHYIYGMAALLIGMVLGFFVHPVFAFPGVSLMYTLCIYERKVVRRKAANLRMQIMMELPRFLDLLRTELNVGLPVETAIYVICERTDTLLSKEFFQALHRMEFGAGEWGTTLEQIAAKYNVEPLSSFVLNIVTAYRKGVSVSMAVDREYHELHKTYLIQVKERAENTKSAVLIPMFVFQLAPLFIFIAFPMLVTVMDFM